MTAGWVLLALWLFIVIDVSLWLIVIAGHQADEMAKQHDRYTPQRPGVRVIERRPRHEQEVEA